MRIAGVQAEYQLVARTTEPLAVIPEVMAGQTVEIIVQGVNGNNQGVASEPVFFTLPEAAKAAGYRRLAVPTTEVPEAGENSNGHRNGNGRHAGVV